MTKLYFKINNTVRLDIFKNIAIKTTHNENEPQKEQQ